MKPSRWVLIFWVGVVAVLLAVELAEITQLFTLPIQSILANPISFISALVFTTILALVGAIFIGLYISERWLGTGQFSTFEEEMLQMRGDVRDLKVSVEKLREQARSPDPPREDPKVRR
ncbi:MAG: hypothetical protein WAN74_04400 [Thermoplasmata archaeon]